MSVIIKRDETGATPLFYTVHNGELFHAANIRELLEISGVKPRLNAESIAAIALTGPGRPLHNAVFTGIKELPPGFSAEFDGEQIKLTQYWKPLAKPHDESFEETAARVREMLVKSIESKLSENPCLFLSGGLDSSIIGAVMKQAGVPIRSYSVDYAGNSENYKASDFSATQDAPYAAQMAELIGAKHRNVILDTEMLFDSLKSAVIARGLPGMADVDGSLLLFCEQVAKLGESAALSGETADEIFGGYRWYFDEDELLNQNQAHLPWMKSVSERAYLLREGVLGGIAPQEYIQKVRDDIVREVDFLDSDDELTWRRREMFCMNYYGFMQTLCERGYSQSKAAGLSIIMPFSDAEIAEYAYNIPWEMKAFQNREKGLLRQAFSDILPDEVAWRKKSPFPKTHNPQYMRLVTLALGEIIARRDCRICEIYDRRKLTDLIESQGSRFTDNWFGQLMSVPQTFAYLIQLEYWLREFNVHIDA
jgi:asparagine synthase (glutamine-hydrolysing)